MPRADKAAGDRVELTAAEGATGRLDVFLTRHLPDLSRRRTRELIDRGLVRINGRRARKGAAVQPGDVVRIDAAAEPVRLAPQPALPVPVIYADAAIVVVDKPAGLPSEARRAADCDTVANFLIARYPEVELASPNPLEAGLAHRLDPGTSGVLVAARTPEAFRELRRQFRDHEVAKEYLALVEGDIARAGRVDLSIAHIPRHPRRMCACADPRRARRLRARPAVTVYRPLERFGVATLVAIETRTGVRHQIRVHLAAIGHPVAGDPLYGTGKAQSFMASRPLLHARQLQFRHPARRGSTCAVEAPLPADMQDALHWLRAHAAIRR